MYLCKSELNGTRETGIWHRKIYGLLFNLVECILQNAAFILFIKPKKKKNRESHTTHIDNETTQQNEETEKKKKPSTNNDEGK